MSNDFDDIADFALNLGANDIPARELDFAALMLLDTLGITIASIPMQAGKIAYDSAYALYGSNDDRFVCQMLFDGRKASIAGAGFAAASACDNLDGHDGYNSCKGHIGVAVIPALGVMAQVVDDISGMDALANIVVGYEIATRAGLALHASVCDYHTSGAWNALGVAAMGARMRGHNALQLRHGLGIAEYHGPRSQMMREIANPTMLHDGSGMGCLVGLSACVMAEMGFTGAPAITIEGQNVADFWQDLHQSWMMSQQYVKPYPICRWAHGAIDAMQKLRADPAYANDKVARVDVYSFDQAQALFQTAPQSTSQAQYSISFAIGAMAVHGDIGLKEISEAGLQDRDVLEFMKKIHIHAIDRHNERFPSGRWANMDITLHDGTRLQSGDMNARGGPDDPFDEAAICEKFMRFATSAMPNARAGAIRDAVLSLRDGGAKLSTLVDLLRDPLS